MPANRRDHCNRSNSRKTNGSNKICNSRVTNISSKGSRNIMDKLSNKRYASNSRRNRKITDKN
jgi:hypothetical protein